jgi:[acyl-carrier-protein] S-malonyltransferase
MRPAAERLRAELASVAIAPPQIAVINNVDVKSESAPDAIRDALYRQAFCPVRWVEVIQALRGRDLLRIIECGPGKVLAGMVKRIDPDAVTATVFDPASLTEVKSLVGGGAA